MKRTIPALLLLTAASFAYVPVSFSSGTPAKAADVNANFASLDSAIQKKADGSLVSVLQTAVAGKADLATVTGLQSSKADTSALRLVRDTVRNKANQADLNAKKDSAWIVNAINGKLPTGALTQSTADSRYLNKSGDTLNGTIILRGGAAFRDSTSKRSWIFGYGSTYIGIGSAASGNGLPVTIWTGTPDTAAVFAPDHVSLGRSTYVSGSLKVNSGSASGGSSTLLGSGLSINRTFGYIQTTDSTQLLILQTNETRFMDQSNTIKLASIKNVGSKGNLYVSGSITTGAGSTVPDYVFEPGYKLASLSEIEEYTKANKHLPEVPSATEIEQGGMDLAKMNLLLLKKVEELTLHSIELEKRLKVVEASQKP